MLSHQTFKLLFFSLLLCCCSNASVYAQTWKWVNPSPHNNMLFSIFFLNTDTGWAAGESGTIMKTTNGGASWEVQSYGRDSLHTLFFIDENTGWAVGNHGTCVHTIDGGENWEAQNSNTTKNITTIFFIDTNTGWIAGEEGMLMHTTNGGENWTTQSLPSFSDVSAISFINAEDGWISTTTGVIIHTSNGGNTWTSIANTNVDKINDLQFMDTKNAWAVGKNDFKGIILRSINGGVTWKKIFIVDNSPELDALHFYSNSAGWVSGELGLFMKTENTGLSWDQYFFEGSGTDIFALETGSIWLTNGSGNIRTSHNEGADWTNNTKGFLDDLSFIFTKDNLNIWALVNNSNKIYVSDDAGLSWTENYSLLQENKACYFINPNKGLAVGKNGTISRFVDNNWTHIESPVSHHLNQVKFWSSQKGWIVGNHGSILKSTNAGASWNLIESTSTNDLLDLFMLNDRDIWIVGKNGTLLHSLDAGASWIQLPLGVNEHIHAIEFINNKYGWLAGENGLIYATQNGGLNWTSQTLPNNLHETISNIAFTSITNGYCIAQNSNKIYHTTDGGENWTISYGLVNVKTKPYTYLCKSEDKTLFIAGKLGTIGKLKSEDDDFIESVYPSHSLNEYLECYPSPTTGKINLTLSSFQEFKTLKIVVFDLMGKQVLQKPFSSSALNEIDLSFYSDGLYLLSLIDNQSGILLANRKIVLGK